MQTFHNYNAAPPQVNFSAVVDGLLNLEYSPGEENKMYLPLIIYSYWLCAPCCMILSYWVFINPYPPKCWRSWNFSIPIIYFTHFGNMGMCNWRYGYVRNCAEWELRRQNSAILQSEATRTSQRSSRSSRIARSCQSDKHEDTGHCYIQQLFNGAARPDYHQVVRSGTVCPLHTQITWDEWRESPNSLPIYGCLETNIRQPRVAGVCKRSGTGSCWSIPEKKHEGRVLSIKLAHVYGIMWGYAKTISSDPSWTTTIIHYTIFSHRKCRNCATREQGPIHTSCQTRGTVYTKIISWFECFTKIFTRI